MENKIFIAGPIFRTIDSIYLSIMEDAFKLVTKHFRDLGYLVVNPFEIFENLTDTKNIKLSIAKMLECDEIFLVKGWQKCDVCNDMYTLAANYYIVIKQGQN